MLAGHFAFAYGAGQAWLVLIAIMLLGVLSRVFYNLRHQGRTIWALPVLGVGGVLLLAWALKPDDSASGGGAAAVAFSSVAPVIAQRCAPCHAQSPSQPGFSSPPAGIVLETPEQIAAHADEIKSVVAAKAMPLGNLTGMTSDERALVVAWVTQGASTGK